MKHHVEVGQIWKTGRETHLNYESRSVYAITPPGELFEVISAVKNNVGRWVFKRLSNGWTVLIYDECPFLDGSVLLIDSQHKVVEQSSAKDCSCSLQTILATGCTCGAVTRYVEQPFN